MTYRPSTSHFLFLLVLAAAQDAVSQSAVPVTLTPTTSPSAGEPGVSSISVTGSNFPAGTILAANVTISLRPAAGGTAVTTAATGVATVIGTTRRVSFTIPPSISVLSPTSYTVSLSGTTSASVTFASSNTASLSINPLATLTSLTPNSGQTGQTLTVAVIGSFSNFLQGVTVANFGAGININSTSITDATHASVNISIASNASASPRSVTLVTGAELATISNGFTITAASNPPTITDFNPKRGPIGTSITVTGTNLQPNSGTSAQVVLAKQGGGTIAAFPSTITATSLTFVIPAGAATSVWSLVVNGNSVVAPSALSITPSSAFTLSVVPSTANVIQGQSAAYAVSLGTNNGFNQLAVLSVAGLPPGVTASFLPSQITAGQISVLTVSASSAQPTGASTLVLSAVATVNGTVLTGSSQSTLAVLPVTTSFLGRTVVSDALETPLANVTVTLLGKDGNGNTTGCHGSTLSDAGGNFALTNLPQLCVGPQLVGYNGLTATSPPGTYAGVNLVNTLVASKAIPAPMLVHLPRIDDQETFNLQQNAPADQTYSYHSIPGLSVTVYAHTVFTMPDGTQPNPFPLTAVQVPVDRLPDIKPPVPTMVTPFIVAFQPANAFTNEPVAVFYPNPLNTPPGAAMTLLTLDPTHGTMVPYGTGSVSNDGSQIVPSPDPAFPGHLYGLIHFDWHMPGYPLPNQMNPCAFCPVARKGHPVDLSSGLAVVTETDISFGGSRGTISIERTYRNGVALSPTSASQAPFGYGSGHNFAYELSTISPSTVSVMNLIMPDGNQYPFTKQAASTFVNTGIPSMGGAVMTVEPDNSSVDLRWKDGTVFRFIQVRSGVSFREMLDSITDRNGNKLQFTHTGFNIMDIVDPVGRKMHFDYTSANYVSKITAPDGTAVNYTYDGGGLLRVVTHPDGTTTRYDYDIFGSLTAETDGRGVVIASNTFDANKRVSSQRLANGGSYQFSYTLQNPLAGSLSPVLQTTVTDPLGHQSIYRFSATGALLGVTDALGQTRTFDRDGNNNVVALKGTAICDACGNSGAGDESYSYDANDNLVSQTDAFGNTTTLSYDRIFNLITSIQDALGDLTTFTYDAHGNLQTQTDPNGNVTSYQYDSFGELVQTADPLNQKTLLSYDSLGNLVSVKDPLGNITSFQYDFNGRLTSTQDALGRTSLFAYDASNRIVKKTNAQGGATRFVYDQVGNLLSLTDPRSQQTFFTYDLMNGLITRTDPLGRTDSRAYDLNEKLTSFVDRRGQTNHFAYDTVDQLVAENYQDGSAVARSYDANGRLASVNDSTGGDFSFAYDSAGRLTGSATPNGSIQYTRDGLGRTTSRQVIGQTAVSYTYDSGGNLISASMPQASANFKYDPRNLLSNITRLNGVSSGFGYDASRRLTSINHLNGTNVIDAESYGYDAVGNRTARSTSIGQSLITQAVVSAAYDADDEQSQFGSIVNKFDANGNLVSSTNSNGTSTFNWDSRNRLASVITSAGQITNFTYDYTGELIGQADVGPAVTLATSFILDDLTNVAYEAASDGTAYSVLSGQAIDSNLAIVPSSGTALYGLTDAINSTVATTDQLGAVASKFVYDLFGQSGVSSSPYPFRFAGRTMPSTNLYYNRARFYNTQTGRFISEDPIGLAGGDTNLYRYVWGNPTTLIDPVGLQGWLSNAAQQGREYAGQLADYGNLPGAFGAETLSLLVQASLFTPLGQEIDILTDPCKSIGQKAFGVALAIGLEGSAEALGELKTAYLPYSGYGLNRSIMATLAFSTFRVNTTAAAWYAILDTLKTSLEVYSGDAVR